MIEYKEIPSVIRRPESFICDVCKKKYTDTLEMQEFQHIEFDGGYGSVFGDESLVEIDICQHCFKRLLGKYCRIDVDQPFFSD